MDKDQSEPTLDESVKEVMQTLPPVIRNYLSQGKYTDVAKNLASKYGLRIDQAGILEREIMLLLMGIENPIEFTQSLAQEAKLDQKTIDGITEDINTQIFAPLRQEEGRMNKVSPTIPPAPPQRAVPPRPINAGVPSYAPPLQSPMYARPINKIPPAESAPVFQPKKVPAPWGSFNKPAQEPQKNVSNTPLRAAIASAQQPMSSRMLEDHEEPHIEFSEKPSAPVPVQRASTPPITAMPQRSATPPAMTMQSQRSVPPPQNLPGVMPSGVIPPGGRPTFTVAPKVVPSAPPPRPVVSVPPTPSVPTPSAPKSYSTDPYREPVDE